jgi:hypothetical protein
MFHLVRRLAADQARAYMVTMPKHDLPDGNEAGGNLIDFREHLRRRVELTTQDNGERGPEKSAWETYRFAEYGDGKRAKFNRYDLLLVGLFLAVPALLWALVFR